MSQHGEYSISLRPYLFSLFAFRYKKKKKLQDSNVIKNVKSVSTDTNIIKLFLPARNPV